MPQFLYDLPTLGGTTLKNRLTAAALFTLALTNAVALAQWTVTNLHPANESSPFTTYTYTSSRALSVRNGQQVGSVDYVYQFGSFAPVVYGGGGLWTGSSTSYVRSGVPILDTDGAQWVLTSVLSFNCVPVFGCSYEYSAILANPNQVILGVGESYFAALGVDGTQQVGCANGFRAALWTGTAASLVSLHPTVANVNQSFALDVRTGHQVGYATFFTDVDHACRWTGTAASFVDLHPPAALESQAHDVDNGVQVGEAWFGGAPHAALWTGTAESFVDLHPSWATSVGSYTRGVCSGIQAGSAFSDRWRATIWRGTAASAFDLHAFLPPDFIRSYAEDVDAHGGTLTVVGYGFNATTNREEALMWTAPIAQITQPPTNVMACPGTPAVFTVGVVAGYSTPTYRWRKNSVNLVDDARITGSGTPTLTIADVGAGDIASYDCIVSDALITLDSPNATLALAAATASKTPNSRICPGASTTLSLVVSASSTPTAYQWRRNGVAVNVGSNPSAATASLSLPSAMTADAGSYDCLITTSCGVIDSSDVTVTIGNIDQPPTNQVGCVGGSATFTVVMDQSRPNMQWLKNGNPITGNATATTPTLVLNNLSAADAASYSFRYNANSGCGMITTNSATLTVQSGSASIGAQPSNTSTCSGGTASFTVTPSGAGPFTYQWRKGITSINTTTNPSAATSTLTLSSVQAGDVGSYDCIVTSACGGVTSNPATLAVCFADLNCDAGVDINDLLAFLAAFENGSLAADLDNGTSSGTPDGGIDINDLLFFLARFEAGC